MEKRFRMSKNNPVIRSRMSRKSFGDGAMQRNPVEFQGSGRLPLIGVNAHQLRGTAADFFPSEKLSPGQVNNYNRLMKRDRPYDLFVSGTRRRRRIGRIGKRGIERPFLFEVAFFLAL